jgi:imidazolonepropionase-like amidohydrolase
MIENSIMFNHDRPDADHSGNPHHVFQRRIMPSKPILVAAWCLFFLIAASGAHAEETRPAYALEGCRVVTVAGPVLEKGIIIIRDGLIEAVGESGKIKIPSDAEVVAAEGLTAYPGLILGHTGFLIERPRDEAPEGRAAALAAAAAAGRQAEETPKSQPLVWAFDRIKPQTQVLENLRRSGVTTILVAPAPGIFQGLSVLLNLNGDKAEPMVFKNGAALHINFAVERGSYPSSPMGTMAFLRQRFHDVLHYAEHLSRYEKAGRGMKRPTYDPLLEALIPFVKDRRPVVFQCNDQEDIKRALRLAEEFRLNAMIGGANEAWRVAADLKKSGRPLFVSLNFAPPPRSVYTQQGEDLQKKAQNEIYPANAARLAEAGIPFALTALGLPDGAAALRNVRTAIKAGLSADEALKALTIVPARFLGAADRIGSLETGKIANVVLVRGDIFDEKAVVERVFVDGLSFTPKPPEKPKKPEEKSQ